jgi:molecular chaperone HscC
MAPIIGIDLGTTNSLVAYLSDAGPVIIPNALGERLTPSIVGVDDDGTLLVGAAARELQVVKPNQCAALFKRHMGSDWSAELGKRKFSAEELSSLVLRALKRDAEAYFKEPLTRAVITVPAYFNNRQRQATIRAGELAELHVERILNEPTAASLAYGFHGIADEKTLLVFDLGGGTFDVSLVDMFDGVLEVRASSGECFLGGEDFTRAMAARLLETRKIMYERAELEKPLMVSRLIRQCELAKRQLSAAETTTVRLPSDDGGLAADAPEVTVTRSDVDSWTRHYLARMELPLRRVLGDARLNWNDIDEVILVGGATRMPSVVEMVRQISGQAPQCRHNPDEVVALGAAVQAGLQGQSKAVEDLVVTDVAPFTLGVETVRDFGAEFRDGYFTPIIFRNTTIPVSRVERVFTIRPNQTVVKVKIYQGEARRVADNIELGEFEVRTVPAAPAGKEAVDIRFTYDLNGVLEVEATVVSTGAKYTHVVTRHAAALSPRQLAAAVEALQKLKTDPRDLEVNRLLLRRAERLYEELPMDARTILGSLLDGFEQALSMSDAATIERHREALANFLDEFDAPDDPEA